MKRIKEWGIFLSVAVLVGSSVIQAQEMPQSASMEIIHPNASVDLIQKSKEQKLIEPMLDLEEVLAEA